MKRLLIFTAMSNFRFAAAYLLHKFMAKNRHGLHSPFVYRLVDEVIYDFSDKKEYHQIEAARKRLSADQSTLYQRPKLVKLIYRLIADRQPKSILEIGEGREISALYASVLSADAKLYSPKTCPAGVSPDVVWINSSEILKSLEWCLPRIGDSTMILINDIHHDKKNREAWNTIKANPLVTATVDLYFIGLVFFRKGQVKEDFRIRF